MTNDDTTPFVRAKRSDRKARWSMCKWLYAAGAERLNYLARIRCSAASRRFARGQLTLLIAAAVLTQVSHTGWHRVIRTADNASWQVTEPQGSAWYKTASAEISPTTYGLVALWWNPVQCLFGVLVVILSGLMAAWVLMLVLRVGANTALDSAGRAEGRMGAAIEYGSAWAHPIYYAAWLLLIIPLRDLLELNGLPIAPPASAVYVVAAVVAGSAGLLWWFWLVRLATTLPQGRRAGGVAYFAVVAPLLIAGMLVGWRSGLDALYSFLWPQLNLMW